MLTKWERTDKLNELGQLSVNMEIQVGLRWWHLFYVQEFSTVLQEEQKQNVNVNVNDILVYVGSEYPLQRENVLQIFNTCSRLEGLSWRILRMTDLLHRRRNRTQQKTQTSNFFQESFHLKATYKRDIWIGSTTVFI